MSRVFKEEPTLVRAVIIALLAVLATFIPSLPVDLLDGLTVAVLALVQGALTRPAVTPNSKVVTRVDSDGIGP